MHHSFDRQLGDCFCECRSELVDVVERRHVTTRHRIQLEGRCIGCPTLSIDESHECRSVIVVDDRVIATVQQRDRTAHAPQRMRRQRERRLDRHDVVGRQRPTSIGATLLALQQRAAMHALERRRIDRWYFSSLEYSTPHAMCNRRIFAVNRDCRLPKVRKVSREWQRVQTNGTCLASSSRVT